MKRSTILIIVVIFISVLGGGLLGFYFYLNSSSVNRSQFGEQNINTGSGFGSPSINTSILLPGNSSSTLLAQTPEIVPVATSTKEEPVTPILRKIHSEPVPGFDFFTENIYATTSAITETVVVANGTTSASTTKIITPEITRIVGKKEMVHFFDRGSGHIYKTSSSTFETNKVSNTTIPKIYEATFLSSTTFLLRGLYKETDIIETKLGTLKTTSPTSTEQSLLTQSITNNLVQVALSPNKQKIFSLQDNSQATGIISNPDGTNTVTALKLPFTEWNISWPSEKQITLTTRPSAFTPGFLYTLHPSTFTLEKILGNILGLTTNMSPNGNKVLYTKSESGSPNLHVYDIKTKKSTNLFFRTFTEKCIWSTKDVDIVYCAVPQDIAYGDYPDVWYQGLIFFSDDIWKINTKTGEARLLAKLNQLNEDPIDATNLLINKTEDFILFNNKQDLSLWGLKIQSKIRATSTASSTPLSTATSTKTR